ncbi:hypothetical protein A6770_31795 [Nostoc minutum NIES-26]|uniref:Uncharacterized protein n=1 Tax=Nostoc minutum NIES-26 TaxID=1844469 RepID=A0A367Q8A4_9NOSO|nr:hypothetical protein A6770_31795 [Nostoc minutum NIES-26]
MILATTVHNALMLSNDIGQTLFSIISNVLTLFGLKKEDGSAFDLKNSPTVSATCFNGGNPPSGSQFLQVGEAAQRTAHRNAVAPHERLALAKR